MPATVSAPRWLAGLLLAATAACGKAHSGTPYIWNLPAGFPIPKVPDDNPMTEEKVQLGRYLFYDKRLSGNGTLACASCHQQEHAFTDGRERAVGSTGSMTPHNAMSLTNVAYNSVSTWWDPQITSLESQAAIPMYNTNPVELGVTGMDSVILGRFQADSRYKQLFPEAFPDSKDPFTMANVIDAITSFERTIVSGNSPFDQWQYQHGPALPDDAMAGYKLFFSEACECYHCHGGVNFTDDFATATTTLLAAPYHNTGLYNVGGTGACPPGDIGKMTVTGNAADMCQFRAPTLRNLAYTAPYYHDGTGATLEDVLKNYERGGRDITSGPYAGDGAVSPLKGPFIRGFPAQATVDGVPYTNDEMVADLLAFLQTLNDPGFVTNPDLSDPNPAQ